MAILEALEIAVCVMGADVATFTFIWRQQTGKWWWKRVKDFNVWFNADGFGIEGKGNPVTVLSAMIDKLMESAKENEVIR